MKLVKILCAVAIAATASVSVASPKCSQQSSAKMFDSTAVKQVAAVKTKPAVSGSAVRAGAN
ncbi:hypothetical protein [Bdellovibrio sp. HCB209]|uniref:hypothetical protein n=1 Tax=Bdellovibrio sp. HCB209 TaxID=3394354 RepID=UPI0039B541E9